MQIKSTLLAVEARTVKRDSRVGGSQVELSSWREGVRVSPVRASLDNPDRSCFLRSRWWREGGRDIDGEGGVDEKDEEEEEVWLKG